MNLEQNIRAILYDALLKKYNVSEGQLNGITEQIMEAIRSKKVEKRHNAAFMTQSASSAWENSWDGKKMKNDHPGDSARPEIV